MNLSEIGAAIGLGSVRAVKNNLNLLLEENWIGYNKITGNYFIRGFNTIKQQHGWTTRTAAEFDCRKIMYMKAFTWATVIGRLARKQKTDEWRAGRKEGHPIQAKHRSAGYYPVSCKALSNIFDVSISTAYEMKQLAEKAGFLLIIRSFEDTGAKKGDKNAYQIGVKEQAHKVRIKKGKLMLQLPDLIKPCIRYTTRKKIET